MEERYIKQITQMHTTLKRLEAKLDGKGGIIEQFIEFKGGLKVLLFLASTGGLASIVALVRTFM